MNTKKWGPPAWVFLHTIAHNYTYGLQHKTSTDIVNYSEWFRLLGKVLPCGYCRKSYSTFFDEIKIDDYLRGGPNDEKNLAKWMWIVHNKVTTKLRSQHDPTVAGVADPPFIDIYHKYQQFEAKTCTKPSSQPIQCVYQRVYVPYGGAKPRYYSHNT
jgi:hypothetical protein